MVRCRARLLVYMAWSACWRSSAAWSPARARWVPKLPPMVTVLPWMRWGSASECWILAERAASPVVSVRGEDGEFVAAEPGDGVRGAHQVSEPPGDGEEDLVAGAVSVGVVDGLESFEIDIQHTDVGEPVLAEPWFQCGFESHVEQGAVHQAGERVVGRRRGASSSSAISGG